VVFLLFYTIQYKVESLDKALLVFDFAGGEAEGLHSFSVVSETLVVAIHTDDVVVDLLLGYVRFIVTLCGGSVTRG